MSPMVTVHADRCPQNHRCPALRVCPVGALSQVGFSAPSVDEARCTDCGRCARACSTFSVDSAPRRARRSELGLG